MAARVNPARSLASAVPAGEWRALWIYFVAPPAGMLLAAEWYVRRHGAARVFCAKLDHDNHRRCIFHCRRAELDQMAGSAAASPAPMAATGGR